MVNEDPLYQYAHRCAGNCFYHFSGVSVNYSIIKFMLPKVFVSLSSQSAILSSSSISSALLPESLFSHSLPSHQENHHPVEIEYEKRSLYSEAIFFVWIAQACAYTAHALTQPMHILQSSACHACNITCQTCGHMTIWFKTALTGLNAGLSIRWNLCTCKSELSWVMSGEDIEFVLVCWVEDKSFGVMPLSAVPPKKRGCLSGAVHEDEVAGEETVQSWSAKKCQVT